MSQTIVASYAGQSGLPYQCTYLAQHELKSAVGVVIHYPNACMKFCTERKPG